MPARTLLVLLLLPVFSSAQDGEARRRAYLTELQAALPASWARLTVDCTADWAAFCRDSVCCSC